MLRMYNASLRCEYNEEPVTDEDEVKQALDVAVDVLEHNVVTPDIDSIIKAVTRETGVTEEEMLARGRQRENVEARTIVSWIAYNYTPMTLTAIGNRLKRDHPTTIHYNRTANGWLEQPKRNLRGARIIQKLIKEFDYDD